MFKVHHNACRPFTQDGHHTRRVIFNWGCGLTSPLQRWWYCHMLLERRAHLLICACYPKLFLQAPHWVPKVLHSDVEFHCPQVHWGNTSHLCWAWLAGF